MRFSYIRDNGSEVYGTFKEGSFNLVLDGSDTVLTCDAAGRPWTLWHRDRTWRRSYSGRVLEVRTDSRGRRRYSLAEERWLARWEPIRQSLLTDLSNGVTLPAEISRVVGRAAKADAVALRTDAARYRSLYRQLGILPPDAAMAVVLQLSEGCPYNRCRFCSFYRERPYRVRSVEEFRWHTEQVRSYFGPALAMRKGIFLADADALAAPDEVLLGALKTTDAQFPGRSVSAFHSTFTQRNRAVDVYREARALGLTRVHLGIESGSPEILDLLGKPTSPDQALLSVERLQSAEINVGVILLVGAGGTRQSDTHIDRSIELVRAMSLGPRDVVYLSELVVESDPRFADHLREAGGSLLSEQGMAAESDAFRQALRTGADGPRVVAYDIRDFLP